MPPLRRRLCQRRSERIICARTVSRGNGHFTKARALAHYEGLMPKLSPGSNIGETPVWRKPLGDLLADYGDPDFSFRDYRLVIPVPLHSRRLRQRGFNQSLLLARRISRRHSLPLDFTALRRIRPTAPQTELSGAERQKNIRGAFAVFKERAVSRKIHSPDRRRLHDRGDRRGMRQCPPQSGGKSGRCLDPGPGPIRKTAIGRKCFSFHRVSSRVI